VLARAHARTHTKAHIVFREKIEHKKYFMAKIKPAHLKSGI
jgi:hypothetical protein